MVLKCTWSANAQTTEQPPSRQLTMKETTTIKQPPRLALVIGNANYEKIDKLKNSSADASDMTVALQALGFEVMSGIDQNRKQMMTLIRAFSDKLNSQKGVGLFFYAGHGVQSDGKNYLVPVGNSACHHCLCLCYLLRRHTQRSKRNSFV